MTQHFKLITFFSLIALFLLLAYSHNSQSKEPTILPPPTLGDLLSDIFTNLKHDLIHGTFAPNETSPPQNKFYPTPPNTSITLLTDPLPLSPQNPSKDHPTAQKKIEPENDEPYDFNDTTLREDYLFDEEEFNQYGMHQHDILIHAPITNLHVTQNRLEVSPVIGQPAISILIDASTQIHNQERNSSLLQLSDITVNDFVDIVAFENHEGLLIAIDITLSNDTTTKVQGSLQKNTIPFHIKTLDIEFIIDETTEVDTFFLVALEDSEPPKSTDYSTNAQFINALVQYYSHLSQENIKVSITSQSHQPNVAQAIVIQ